MTDLSHLADSVMALEALLRNRFSHWEKDDFNPFFSDAHRWAGCGFDGRRFNYEEANENKLPLAFFLRGTRPTRISRIDRVACHCANAVAGLTRALLRAEDRGIEWKPGEKYQVGETRLPCPDSQKGLAAGPTDQREAILALLGPFDAVTTTPDPYLSPAVTR